MRDSRDVKFKKPRHKRHVIVFAFQTVDTCTQKSKEIVNKYAATNVLSTAKYSIK